MVRWLLASLLLGGTACGLLYDVDELGDTDGDGVLPGCDREEIPDVASGVFVSAEAPDGGTGSQTAPFRSLREALTAAAAQGRSHVYVAHGNYDEPSTIVVQTDHAIEIDGGWLAEAALWRRDCSTKGRSLTFVRSGSQITMDVKSAPGITLSHLTMRTKVCSSSGPDTVGETCIGLRVAAAAKSVVLDDVAIIAEEGGAGGPPAEPESPGAVPCGGINDCVPKGATPKPGFAGKPGANAASGGTFDATGAYIAGDGIPGEPGGAGENGSAGDPGQSSTCVWCDGTCPYSQAALFTGVTGTCGCGGRGGEAGRRGRGGGASVAVLASGLDVTITLRASELVARSGGNGSSGSASSGGSPTNGKAGAGYASCAISCTCMTACTSHNCYYPAAWSPPISGGAAGGEGAPGGNGGKAGGGAGGPSHSVVLVAGAKLDTDAQTKLGFAGGGLGADGAANGASASTLVVKAP